jgi:hypothetical protein
MVGLPWEIIVEIAKYLSLNDAISAFSIDILRLLDNSELNFQLSNPSIPFIKMILKYFKVKQIVSLQLNAIDEMWSERNLSIFQNVISITLLNLPYDNEILYLEKYFPNLTCLSLWYDNEINFNKFKNLFSQLWQRIKRFEIHCAGTICIHSNTDLLNKWSMKNSNIEYFFFNVGDLSLISANNCFRYYTSCFLASTIDFIKKMTSIRYVYLIINKYNVEQLLNIYEWKTLINECLQLNKITLEVLGNTFYNEQLKEKGRNIQTQLRTIRQTIKFQIKFL